jgi:hypothetical protein
MKRRVSDMPVPDNDVQYGQIGRGAFLTRRRRGICEVGRARENRISSVRPSACRADGGANRAPLNPV